MAWAALFYGRSPVGRPLRQPSRQPAVSPRQFFGYVFGSGCATVAGRRVCWPGSSLGRCIKGDDRSVAREEVSVDDNPGASGSAGSVDGSGANGSPRAFRCHNIVR